MRAPLPVGVRAPSSAPRICWTLGERLVVEFTPERPDSVFGCVVPEDCEPGPGGGEPPGTTSVVGETAGAPAPYSLDTVSTIRSVCPASALVTVYLRPVAPAIAAQLWPLASQRSHW